MKKFAVKILCLLFVLHFSACQQINSNFQAEAKQVDYLHRSMKKLTDVMVHYILSLPVASRIYAYPSMEFYN